MKPEEIRQLLGGYASGTLSEAERKFLFEAAMEDQVLFDALADEQSLKDLLEDPESRGYLQAVLDEERLPDLVRPFDSALMPPAPAQASPAPQAAAPIMRERVVKPAPQPYAPAAPRRPAMWWGLLAAAALATVSVVGILKLTTPPAKPPTELAKNTVTSEKPAAVPAQNDEAKPAVAKSSEAQPAPATKAQDKRTAGPTPTTVAGRKDAAPGTVEPKVALKEERERRPEEKHAPEPQKPRDEDAASEPRQRSPVQAEATRKAASPPPPAQPSQQQVNKEAAQQQALRPPAPPEALSQDHLQQMRTQMAPSAGARQLYMADNQPAPAVASTGVPATGGVAPVTAGPESGKPESDKKAKRATPAAVAGGGGALAARRASTPAASPAVSTKPAFAMRYRILRKAGGDFVPVPPGARFKLGDELVVVIDKNSGGIATIGQLVEGAARTVPMAIQTSAVARSVPLTVTGPMDLAVVLNRAGAVPGIPSQPASQKTEVADGMVYVAEPTASSGQPLVIHIPIRLE